MIIYFMSKFCPLHLFFQRNFKMTEESAKINSELTKNAVEIRQIVQDFPLCSTFKEIDEQNVLGKSLKLHSAVLMKTTFLIS